MRIFLLLMCLMVPAQLFADEPDERVALQNNYMSVTAYELKKNMGRDVVAYQERHNAVPPADSLQLFVGKYINKYYLVSEAYRLGYDKKASVNEVVDRMAEQILTQEHGLLYEDIVRSVTVSDDEVRREIDVLNAGFPIEYLAFIHPEDAGAAFPNPDAISIEEFKRVAGANEKNENVIHREMRSGNPVRSLMEMKDSLAVLQPGKIPPPIHTKDAVFVLNPRKAGVQDTTNQKDFDSMRRILQHRKESAAYGAYIDGLMAKAELKISDDVCTRTAAVFAEKKYRGDCVPEDFAAILADTIAIYSMNGVERGITVGNFVSDYNGAIMRSSLRDAPSIAGYLNTMSLRGYMLEDTQKRGLDCSKQFLLDRKNYLRTVMVSTYEKEVLRPAITISDASIRQEYRARKNEFRDGVESVVTLLRFSDGDSARIACSRLKREVRKTGKATGFAAVPGLLAPPRTVTVNFADTSYSKDVLEQAFSLKDNTASRPAETVGGFLVIYKHRENGERIKSIGEVRDMLVNALTERELAARESQLVAQIQKRNPLKKTEAFASVVAEAARVR